MMTKASKVIAALQGRTLATAESLTGGGIGAALTAVPGASAVFKGGVISYTNEIKYELLCVGKDILERSGAVSWETAHLMAMGVRNLMETDFAISATGLAGPAGDDYGNPVGTVFMAFATEFGTDIEEHHFSGDRESIRNQTIEAALNLILKHL